MAELRALAGALVVAVGVGASAWAVAASQSGCQLQGVCDPSTVYLPGASAPAGAASEAFPAGAGMYVGVDGIVWQTSAIEGTWLELPGQRTNVITPPFPGPYTFPQVMVSADPAPGDNATSNFAPSAGNIVELTERLPDGGTSGFQVKNDTCSPYYLWLQVAPEYPPEADAAIGPVQTDGAALSDAGGD